MFETVLGPVPTLWHPLVSVCYFTSYCRQLDHTAEKNKPKQNPSLIQKWHAVQENLKISLLRQIQVFWLQAGKNVNMVCMCVCEDLLSGCCCLNHCHFIVRVFFTLQLAITGRNATTFHCVSFVCSPSTSSQSAPASLTCLQAPPPSFSPRHHRGSRHGNCIQPQSAIHRCRNLDLALNNKIWILLMIILMCWKFAQVHLLGGLHRRAQSLWF